MFPLDRRTEFQIGGTWTDVTGDVRESEPIVIERGAKNEAAKGGPSKCTLKLNNRHGRYSPRNPLSPYYGLIGRNTPIRVSVKGAESYLRLEGNTSSYARTPDAAALDITGDIDLRVEATCDWWAVPVQTLLGKWVSATAQRSYMLRLENGVVNLSWSVDGTVWYFASQLLPALPKRAALRATLDVNNGAGGYTARFYWAASLSGTWTPLGDPLSSTPTMSIYAGTAPLEVAPVAATGWAPVRGRVHRAEVRNGINGPLVADFDARTKPEGTTSWADSTGRTWTLGSDATITDREHRFHGEISAWPSRWDVSGADVWVSIEAAGIRRRLGQGQKALASTLRRRIPAFAPLAYWPCEDQDGATQAYSPIEGVNPLTVTDFRFGQDNTLPGSSALPAVEGGGRMVGAVPPPSGTTTQWSVHMVYTVDSPPATDGEFLSWRTTGTVRRWRIVQRQSHADIEGYDAAGDLLVDQAVAIGDDVFEGWQRFYFWVSQSGGTVTWRLDWHNIGGPAGGVGSTYTGTVGRVSQVDTQFGTSISGLKVGHIAVMPVAATAAYTSADHGFSRETAIARMRRLANEESAQLDLTWIDGDTAADTERLGPQRPDTLLTLVQEAADTDGGILYEPAERLGLVYRDRASLYNQPVCLALDYTARGEVPPPLEPIEDDQRLRNDITVTRSGGSSGRAVAETGPLSVLPPPDGVGVYDESVTLSLATDDQPARIAQWRMHLGTWDEARYPTITVWLHAAPHLIEEVLGLDIGDRLQISNPPPWLPPGVIDQHMHGYTERLGLYEWPITMNCAPAGPWQVGVVEDPVLGRADTDGSELASAATASATSLSVAVTVGPRWITGAPNVIADPGFEAGVGAWECTRGASIGVVSWVQGIVRTGVGALRVTRVHPTDTGTMNLRDMTGIQTAAAGQTWTGSAWVYAGGAATNAMRVALVWRTSGGTETYIYGAAPGTPPGSWQQLTVSATLPAGAVDVRLGIEGRSTWTVGEWWQADDIRLARTDTLTGGDNGDQFPFSVTLGGEEVTVLGISGTSSQTFTVARSTNSVAKGHATGTPLSLTYPMRAAL
ncbi:carbohydrate binding domain-containing protein [Streptomyces anulatus]